MLCVIFDFGISFIFTEETIRFNLIISLIACATLATHLK